MNILSFLFYLTFASLLFGFFEVIVIFEEIYNEALKVGLLESIKTKLDKSSEIKLLIFLPATLVILIFSLIFYIFLRIVDGTLNLGSKKLKDFSKEKSYLSKFLDKKYPSDKKNTDLIDKYINTTGRDKNEDEKRNTNKTIIYYEDRDGNYIPPDIL